MEQTKTFVFPDSGNDSTNSIIAMLPALLQRQGVDPALIAMCTNRGAFGNNGLGDLIALVIIAAIFGNGSFGGGLFGNRGGGCALPNMINNDSNTQLLMQMLQRNGVTVEHKGNYDYCYAAMMCKADFYGSSIEDELHMARFIKDTCDDIDAPDGTTMRRWFATMTAAGISVPWEEFLED